VLWRDYLESGQSVPVHTVGLDAPLLLNINLGFCRTPSVADGALIHDGVINRGKKKGKDSSSKKEETLLASEFGKIMSNIGFGVDTIASEMTVVDNANQRLVLRIDNVLGGGGHRRVTVYCPFWIINTTDHALRYKQEGKSSYVSGTVTEGKNGSLQVDSSDKNKKKKEKGTEVTVNRKKNLFVRTHPSPSTTPSSPTTIFNSLALSGRPG
jgi:hypothetical protein